MKHPLHKLGKKNRNVISGLLVGFASIFLIMFYLDVPIGQVGRFLLATAGFVLVVMLAAVLFVFSIKMVMRLFGGRQDNDPEETPYSPPDADPPSSRESE